MKKAQSMIALIEVIGAVIVLAVVVWFFYTKYTSINSSITGLEWDQLSLSEQGRVNTAVGELGSFLKTCSVKSNCFCGSANGFPLTFDERMKIIIDHSKAGSSKISYVWGSNVISEETISEDIFFNQLVYGIMEITFKKGQYFVNGNPGVVGRPAFYNIKGALFIFDNIYKIGALMDTKKDCIDPDQFETPFCQAIKFKQC